MEPSWQPDPTGRHHYRWWDGAAWSDSVSDDGVVSVDALPVPAATITVSTTPRVGEPVAPAVPPSSVYSTEPIRPRRIIGPVIALGVLLLALIGGGVYLLAFRGGASATPESAGTTTGHLSDASSYIVREVTLDDGDAIRYRVEGDDNRDLVTMLVVPEDLAISHAERFFKDYGTNVGMSDADTLISDYTDADDVVSDPDIKDALLGYVVLQDSDRCCVGVPDAGTFIATVPGTYRILVVEAQGRESDVRVIVDKFSRQLFTYAEITDSLDNDQFFTDTSFFEDTEPFDGN
jgi:hypothetical protein